MADEQASAPFCIQCDYNLAGLTGDICPECGWQIDWALAALDEEGRRPGTPAHRAHGWRRGFWTPGRDNDFECIRWLNPNI